MSTGNGKLPAGWRTAKLGDLIVEAATGFACGQRANDGAIQLRMNNVTRRGELDWSSFIRVPVEKAMLDAYALRAGDVVFNNTNSTEMVGKTALFDDFDEPVVFSNHFTRLRTKPDALAPDFLALWLHTQWQAGLFARICDRWIGQSAVQRNKLLALEIPVPPLEEQRRIAVRLREQLSILAEARAALEAQLAAADSLPAAHLRAVFESQEAQSWPAKKLGDVCDRIEYGFTASADFTINDPRFLRITDIQNGRVEWDRRSWVQDRRTGNRAARTERWRHCFRTNRRDNGQEFSHSRPTSCGVRFIPNSPSAS
jgi:type I restriction enzyme S subunit